MRLMLTFTAAAATLLGSVGLHSLFAGGAWFGSVLGVVISVAAMGLLARRFRVPAIIALPAGLAAVHLFLTAAFTSSDALLGVLPTPASLAALGRLMKEGWQAAGEYAAPVPLVPGMMVLVTLGVGVVAAIVDFLAVRLRRVAPAGLPLLAMYSVPAAVREESVSWPAFALGALGFLALLLVDARERLSGWGRPVTGRRWSDDLLDEAPNVGGLTSTGRRIGLTAVVIAVLLPTVIPGIHPRGLFGMGGSDGSGGGSQTVTTPDPLVSLKRELTRQDDAVVLTYRTDDSRQPDYLRLYALDQFNGDRWTYSALRSSAKEQVKDRQLPAPPGLTGEQPRQVTTRVAVDRRVRGMTFLPTPYAPSRVAIKGDWRVHAPSLMVYSLRDSAAGKTYTVRSLRVEPGAERLAEASRLHAPQEITTRFLEVPREVPDRVRQRAERITRSAGSPYDRAVKLQQWFTAPGRFRYDLAAQPPKRTSDLVDFLENNRRGYCEQFAAAMAVLARTLGIPARVAMGYTSGAQDATGLWTVRAKDAHAWPELYFESVGWLRFEPTPGGATGQGTANTPVYADPTPAPGTPGADAQGADGTGASASPQPTTTAGAAQRRPDGLDPALDPDTAAESDGGTPVIVWLLVAGLLLTLLAVPKIVRELSRRTRWLNAGTPRTKRPAGAEPPGAGSPGGDGHGGPPRPGHKAHGTHGAQGVHPAHAAWLELRADVIDHGLAWRLSESPRAAGRRLAEELRLSGPAAEALARIVQAEERARYAPAGASSTGLGGGGGTTAPDPAMSLRTDSRAVRRAIAGSVDPRTRWRARLLPRSTVAELRVRTRRTARRADQLVGAGLRAANRWTDYWQARRNRRPRS